MIDARELRIGNWIFHTGGLGYIQVTGEMIAHVERFPDEKFMTNPPRYILKPIELTEERLIKCGFEKVGGLMRMQSFDGQRRLRFDYEGCAIETVGSGWLWHLPKIKYVHQLQNLYYCLTGTELEIKEL